MTKPPTDERAAQILEMQREAENAPALWAEVKRLRKGTECFLRLLEEGKALVDDYREENERARTLLTGWATIHDGFLAGDLKATRAFLKEAGS